MLAGFSPAFLAFLIVAGPISVLLWAGVLAICGVGRKDIAKWAQRQADKQRVTDLIRSLADLIRGPKAQSRDDEESGDRESAR